MIGVLFALSIIKTDAYNKKVHQDSYTGSDLFRVDEIERNKGTQFDPKIADIFLKIIKSGRADEQ